MTAEVVRLPARGPVPRGLSADARTYLQASATFGLFRGAAEMAHWHLPTDPHDASIELVRRLCALTVERDTAAEALGLAKPDAPPSKTAPAPRAPRPPKKPKHRPLLFEVPLLAVPEPPDAAS